MLQSYEDIDFEKFPDCVWVWLVSSGVAQFKDVDNHLIHPCSAQAIQTLCLSNKMSHKINRRLSWDILETRGASDEEKKMKERK